MEREHGRSELQCNRKERRAKAAQQSADLLASTAQWHGDRAVIDMPSLLSSALTRRQDLLVFKGADFTVSIPMAPLLDLSRSPTMRTEVTGFVDRHGLNLRWKTGELRLRSRDNGKAARIVVNLPVRVPTVAA